MTTIPTKITFFEFLTPLVVSGAKTITIRDKSESHYLPGSTVEVFTLETEKKVCDIQIISVVPLRVDEINEFHAQQESLPLSELKSLIKQIYPDEDQLYMISYKLSS